MFATRKALLRWSALGTLIVVVVLGVACREPTRLVFQESAISATLSEVLFNGESRCRFTLRFQSIDSVTPVSFAWEIDQVRSSIPPVSNADGAEVGSFFGQTSKVWEWRRPDNGSALILSLSYRLKTDRDSVGGRLIRYCP